MRTFFATALPLLLLLWSGPVGAAWFANAMGTGSAVAHSLGIPVSVTAVAPSSSTVVVGWSPPATGPAPGGYTVRRVTPTPTVVCAVGATISSCVDGGLTAATSYSYTVEANLGSWSSPASTPVSVTTPVPGPYQVSIGSGTHTAGSSFTASITATTDGTTVDTSYFGSKAVTFSGPSASPSGVAPAYPAIVVFTAGVGSASITLSAAESVTLDVTDGSRSGSAPVVIGTGAVSQLGFSSASPSCATGSVAVGNGGKFKARVSQFDAYLNPVVQSGGSRTISLSRSPASGTLNRTSLTIPSGASQSSQQFQFKVASGNPPPVSVSAAASGLAPASCVVSKV